MDQYISVFSFYFSGKKKCIKREHAPFLSLGLIISKIFKWNNPILIETKNKVKVINRNQKKETEKITMTWPGKKQIGKRNERIFLSFFSCL